MDIVFLRDLRIDTVIGIYDWERRIRQALVVDLELGVDAAAAAATDAIAQAVDYSAVAGRLREFAQASEFHLVETLAERMAQLLLSEFRLPWLRLTLSKPGAIRGCQAVGVIIERGARTGS